MWHSGLLALMVALPFVGALFAAMLSPNARNAEAWLAGTTATGGLAIAISAYPMISHGGVIRHTIEWVPALGLSITAMMATIRPHSILDIRMSTPRDCSIEAARLSTQRNRLQLQNPDL